MNRLANADGKSKLVGGDDVKKMAGAITCSGGVGPVACLLKNTVTAACALNGMNT